MGYVEEGAIFWPVYSTKPSFGLQALSNLEMKLFKDVSSGLQLFRTADIFHFLQDAILTHFYPDLRQAGMHLSKVITIRNPQGFLFFYIFTFIISIVKQQTSVR